MTGLQYCPRRAAGDAKRCGLLIEAYKASVHKSLANFPDLRGLARPWIGRNRALALVGSKLGYYNTLPDLLLDQ
jgi:hypothetical protein